MITVEATARNSESISNEFTERSFYMLSPFNGLIGEKMLKYCALLLFQKILHHDDIQVIAKLHDIQSEPVLFEGQMYGINIEQM